MAGRRGVAAAHGLGWAYAAVLLAGQAWLVTRPSAQQRAVLHASSTNLVHLARDPVLVLVASGAWARLFSPYWAVVAVLLLGGLQRERGWRQALAVGVAAHVIATLVSEGVVALRISTGVLPDSARALLDVGPSYILVGCGVALAVARWRSRRTVLLVAVLLVPVLATTVEGLATLEVDAVGHAVAALTGAALAAVLAAAREPDQQMTARAGKGT